MYLDISKTRSWCSAFLPTTTPYKSSRLNASFNAVLDPPDQLLEFARPKTFQIVSAGLDDSYGNGQVLEFGSLPASFPASPYGGATLPVFFNYLTNQPFYPHDALPAVDPRVMVDFHYGHDDNIANFSEGNKFEDVEE